MDHFLNSARRFPVISIYNKISKIITKKLIYLLTTISTQRQTIKNHGFKTKEKVYSNTETTENCHNNSIFH